VTLAQPRVTRVLHVHTRYRKPGGEDTVVANLVRSLGEAGLENIEYYAENPNGLATLPALTGSVWNRRQAGALSRVIEDGRPDVTHVHNTWFALSPAVIASAHERGPVAMTLHNYRVTCANASLYRAGSVCERCVEGSPLNGLLLNCYRDPISSAFAAASVMAHRRRDTWNQDVDRFFVLSEFARGIFESAGIDRDRMQVVNNFVADAGPRPRPASESDIVLYVGRLSEEKGIADLAERWTRFGPSGLRLVICGEGPLRSKLAESESIELRGWADSGEVARLMREARALVFPSKWYEGQPLVILEAFAAGLPVLGSRLGGIAELIGFLGTEWQPRHDVDEDWEEGFRLLTTSAVDPASVAVRQRYLRDHTEAVVIGGILDGYRNAIANHPA